MRRVGVVVLLLLSASDALKYPVRGNPGEYNTDPRAKAMLESRLLQSRDGPLNMDTQGSGDPGANPNGAPPPKPGALNEKHEESQPGDQGEAPPSDLEPPNYLPPLQCKREDWSCSCVRECKCDSDGDILDQDQLKIPLIRGLYEEEEHMPAGFKCRCALSQCECTSPGVCDTPHKGDYLLNFIGGLLEVDNSQPYIFNGNSKFTIEAWINLPANMPDPSRVRCLMSRFNYGVSGQFRVWVQDYRVMAQRETTDNIPHRVVSGPIPCCSWAHVAVVYTGRNLVLLINGVVVSMRSSDEAFEDSRSKLLIGACMSEGRYVRAFSGAIDDVRLWNEARTKEEVNEYMFKRIDPYSIGLIGYWRCNLGTGSIVADQSRSKRHAKVIGTVSWEPSLVPIHLRREDVNKFKPQEDKPSCGLPNLTLSPAGDMAYKMPATQTSLGWGGDPSRAVDGVKDGNYGGQHCTHTAHDYEPWWRLDFGTERNVGTVKVLNRADCCWDRLNGFEVYVGNQKSGPRANKICGGSNGVGQGSETTVNCVPPINGRYVFVLIPGREDYLTICNVEALAPPSTSGSYISFQQGKCGEPRVFYKSVRTNNDPGGAAQIKNLLYSTGVSQGTCEIENPDLPSRHANALLCPGGVNSRFAQLFFIVFYEPAGAVDWIFHIRIDSGWGMGAFLDGQQVLEIDSDVYSEVDLKLTKVSQGAHTLEVVGAENCCDGNRGGWEFERAGIRRPLTVSNLMDICMAGSGESPKMVTYFKGPGCTGPSVGKPKGLSINLCDYRYGDGSSMNDAVASISAPAGTEIRVLEHCGPSSIKSSLSFSSDGQCLDVGYAGPSYIKFVSDSCTAPGTTVCSARQLKNALNMGYYDTRWAKVAEDVEANVVGKCTDSSACLEEVVPIRGIQGASTWCCSPPEFIRFASGPIPNNKLQNKCAEFGGMFAPCSYDQLKMAEIIGFRMCTWGRFSRNGWNVAICGNCGEYKMRAGECAQDTLRTTPRTSDAEGVYCCHLGCSG